MNYEEELKIIKHIQSTNDSDSINMLWEKYGERLYLSFLKKFLSKNYNIPLDKEDFISIIYISFKKAIKLFNTENDKYHFLQYAHVATQSDAGRYIKKYISKKQNILNNAYNDNPKFNSIYDSLKNSTQSLEIEYENKLKTELKISAIKYYLEMYCIKNPNTYIKEIINLKLNDYKTKEISKILKIDQYKINHSMQLFKKSFIKHINNNY